MRFFSLIDAPSQWGVSSPARSPHARWVQNEDSYVFTTLAAGLDKEDIVVEVLNNTLSVKWEQEREWGMTNRQASWVLPQDADTENVSAALRRGILTLTVPRVKQSAAVRVEVKDEDEQSAVSEGTVQVPASDV